MKKMFLFILCVFQFSKLYAVETKNSVSGKNLLSDETISIGTENKKALVVVFLSAVCPCSNSHIEELKSLSRDYPEFNFIGIHSNVDETVDKAKIYFSKEALPFKVIQDENAALADRFKAFKTPHAFVVNADGKILYQGGVSSSKNFPQAEHKFLREALTQIQKDETVLKPEGRTLGCSIARNLK